ncbi:MAG: hypothetical protein ACQEQF_03855 [Bacillota bacterium]
MNQNNEGSAYHLFLILILLILSEDILFAIEKLLKLNIKENYQNEINNEKENEEKENIKEEENIEEGG